MGTTVDEFCNICGEANSKRVWFCQCIPEDNSDDDVESVDENEIEEDQKSWPQFVKKRVCGRITWAYCVTCFGEIGERFNFCTCFD
jgi:hypothetical protein